MTNFTEIKTDIEAMNAELQAIREAHMAKMATKFNDIVKSIFDETPLQAITWLQYTPYFNDGDECTFGVNDPVFIFEGFDPDDIQDPYEYEYDENDVGCLVLPTYYKTSEKVVKLLADNPGLEDKIDAMSIILCSNDDLLRETFGDHVQVVLIRDREPEILDYDHE